MADESINRRDFNRLTAAAFGGLVAGTAAGCGGQKPPAGAGGAGAGGGTETAAAEKELHTCRGLNSCKGQGADGKNACAGAGTCATVAHHDCGGKNTCKGLGGCGGTEGKNLCKGNGGCQVPLMESAWPNVRKLLEERLAAEGKPVHPAPPKPMS